MLYLLPSSILSRNVCQQRACWLIVTQYGCIKSVWLPIDICISTFHSHLVYLHLSSAALSMLPWPRPAVWPSVPPDISRLQAKEQVHLVTFYSPESIICWAKRFWASHLYLKFWNLCRAFNVGDCVNMQVSPPKLSDGFGRLRKQLSLSPTVLLREANRRRSSLSVGSLAEMLDLGRLSLKERWGRWLSVPLYWIHE